LTYEFQSNKFNKTLFTCDAVSDPDSIQLSVAGCLEGEGYNTMPLNRSYTFTVHCAKPKSVTLTLGSGIVRMVPEVSALEGLRDDTEEGWCYSSRNGGVLRIKPKTQRYHARFDIHIVK
jgi:hypothetical protein